MLVQPQMRLPLWGMWLLGRRETERVGTENQYIHIIPQCAHFLAVRPYLITEIKARARTLRGLYVFQSDFRSKTIISLVLQNELTLFFTY